MSENLPSRGAEPPGELPTVRLHLFRLLVLSSTVITVLLFLLPVPPNTPPQLEGVRAAAGAGATFFALSSWIFYVLPFVFLLTGLGLFFLTWWSRPLLVAAYIAGFVGNVVGGMVVLYSWENILAVTATLLDGATFALAFATPLSSHFGKPPRITLQAFREAGLPKEPAV